MRRDRDTAIPGGEILRTGSHANQPCKRGVDKPGTLGRKLGDNLREWISENAVVSGVNRYRRICPLAGS